MSEYTNALKAAVMKGAANRFRDVATMDMRDRLGLEHDKRGRFAPKGGGASIAEALKGVEKGRLESMRRIGNYTDANGVKHDTRISKLTGKPISKEMNDIINALLLGLHVSNAEIEKTAEWTAAKAKLKEFKRVVRKKNGVVETVNIDTPERKKRRKEIEDMFMADTITAKLNPDAFKKAEKDKSGLKPWKVKKGKIIDVITGLPAAGKSTVFANSLSVDNQARLIDSDEVKKQFAEFEQGYGASLVHEESSEIAKRILQRSVEQGDNITYPVIGFKPEKLTELFDKVREYGYTVRIHLNELDADKARGRMLLRFAETGRFLPLGLFQKYGNKPTDAYKAVKDKADEYEWYRSDTGVGSVPKLVEKGKGNKKGGGK